MKNGYSESIMDTEQGVCYVCGTHTDTARHEIFYGTANRRLSKQFGTWINVCPKCHDAIHQGFSIDEDLKIKGQIAFQEHYPSMKFRAIFGRNYI